MAPTNMVRYHVNEVPQYLMVSTAGTLSSQESGSRRAWACRLVGKSKTTLGVCSLQKAELPTQQAMFSEVPWQPSACLSSGKCKRGVRKQRRNIWELRDAGRTRPYKATALCVQPAQSVGAANVDSPALKMLKDTESQRGYRGLSFKIICEYPPLLECHAQLTD